MPCVSFYTLGCKLNVSETGAIQRDFEQHAYDIVPFGTPADVVVINTCTVTAEADRKCRQIIRRALKINPDALIAVTGCYAQLRPEEIAGIPGVDVVVGANEKSRLFKYINALPRQEKTQVFVSCIDEISSFGAAFSSSDRTRAFLKIQDGCDYTCSFCTIPLARGRSRSQTLDTALVQARQIAEMGYREIVLSGVNIGLFGQDHGVTLLDLLQALDKVDGIARYRISSIEPNLLSDEIIDFVAVSDKFQPHVHLPLQSGDNDVLAKMRRRYRREQYENRVLRVKARMPDASIGADVIVGFPTENGARFENTYRFLADLPVSYLHAFTYSERRQTVAVDQIDHMNGRPVPQRERSRRNRMLRILSGKKEHSFYQEHQGSVRPVLWEHASDGDPVYGYTDNYIRVQRPPHSVHTGVIEAVRLGDFALDGSLMAEDTAFIALSGPAS